MNANAHIYRNRGSRKIHFKIRLEYWNPYVLKYIFKFLYVHICTYICNNSKNTFKFILRGCVFISIFVFSFFTFSYSSSFFFFLYSFLSARIGNLNADRTWFIRYLVYRRQNKICLFLYYFMSKQFFFHFSRVLLMYKHTLCWNILPICAPCMYVLI